MVHSTRSPLDTLETTFRLLATGPQALALEGHAVGLRQASIGLWELRPILFHPATGIGVQRAVLVELVGRARRQRGAWMIGLVGVLLPGLRRQVASVPESRSGRAASSGPWCLSACSNVWRTRTYPARAPSSHCCGPSFDLLMGRPYQPGAGLL